MAASGGATKISWRLQEFEAHAGRVCCVALSKSTGRLLASGGEDCRVNIWSVSKANCIMSLCGHTKAVECVRFNRSEEQLVTGSQSGSVRVWDLEAAKMLRILTGHKSNITSFGFHPFGDFLVSGSTDTNIKMWDVRRKDPIYRYKGHAGAVRSLAFSPDGKWLASAGDDCTVKLWDLKQAKTITEFTAHTAAVNAIQFHPNEYLLASGGADRWVRLWDLEKFCQVGALQETGAIRCVLFSADGGCLFGGHADVLGVCAWEPDRLLDTVTVGWGRVCDLALSNQQLIGASHQLSSVSTHVVDLKRVKTSPDAAPVVPGSLVTGSQPADPKAGALRRSYERLAAASSPSPSLKQSAEAERRSPEGERRSPSEDEADEKVLSAEIHNAQDYREIFQPRNAISRTPPKMSEPFPAPPEDERPVGDAPLLPERQPGSPSALPTPVQRVEPTVVACVKRAAAAAAQVLPTSERAPLPPQIFPISRKEPTGLNVADFLTGRRCGILNESEVLNHIHNGHATMCVMLSNRRKNLQNVRDVWARQGIKSALDAAVSMNDLSIVVDVLNIINLQPSLWTLDVCATSLPQIDELLQSKYESYLQCGCTSLKIIVKYFWPLIWETLRAGPSSVGVDVTREERQQKCRVCCKHLQNINNVVKSKAARVGRHGCAFGELRLLMAPLDRQPSP
ncbi:katanin p80 WD40 repeat-containing subunit B1 isoform X2 [Syngnathoides biaculeatus]|uniref:katanin p80 WD40 repeat-containing subunit B1 isoform X2 n=1 Tax=Syngnathoides biaculeatus TaxID=300417 RepID=UPI002ADD7D75|nr:katanin p80 WD40 repeat-containing subunit B1 isoform X2 [Syngnathoides biaculeatus]